MVSQINNTQGNNSILSKAKNKTKKDSKFLDMFENLGKTKKIDPKKPISNLSPPTPKSLQKNENLVKQDTNLLSNLLNKENPKKIIKIAQEENATPNPKIPEPLEPQKPPLKAKIEEKSNANVDSNNEKLKK